MSSLLNSLGDMLDPNLKFTINKLGDKYLPNKANKFVDRLPYDQSIYGFLDPILRKLPPDAAREIAKIIKIGTPVALRAAVGIAKELLDKLTKGFVSSAVGFVREKVNELKDVVGDWLGIGGEDPITGNLQLPGVGVGSTIKDIQYRISESTYSKSILDRKNEPTSYTSESDSLHVNEIADKDRINSLKFIPQEDIIWAISLGRYEDPDFGTALPELPKFSSLYNGTSIDYGQWIPADSFTYNRNILENSIKFDYGWGNSFSQISSINRGNEFTIRLVEDRARTFNDYADRVADLSASYTNASVTYWRYLVFQINLLIMNRQWEPFYQFSLLGLLQNKGESEYQPELDKTITYKFSIVGELPEFKPIRVSSQDNAQNTQLVQV